AENGSVRTYKLNVVRQSNAPSVNVGPGYSTSAGSSNGPGGPGASGATSGSTSGGPGAASAGPGVTVPETTAPADATVSVVRPEAPGGSQDVQIGVGPSGSSGNMTSNGTQAPSAITGVQTQAPSETTVPQTQAPAETTAPQTQAPAETKAPETQAPAVQETAAAQTTGQKKGDCNGDGSVTILDLMLINKQVLGQNVLNGAALKAADMNGDGKITSADASAVQKAIFGQ
ncbi:MAG: hypothetical protein II253_06195, partial [Lachnospiraceae bacterium]|nr:hypothetical protein [Lachnospiraceae bacterium]